MEALRALRVTHHDHPGWRSEIDEALARVESGQFGRCVECGDHITPRRLRAAPWAKFCTRCQDVLAAMSARL